MYENGEMRPAETIPRMGEGEDKIEKTFVNVTMYPQYNNNTIENWKIRRWK
jgi:hypothetical protein